MSFPPVIKIIFAADGTGLVKKRLDPVKAARAVRRKRARKISDNLIQYKQIWKDTPAIDLNNDEVVLLGTISCYTKKSGWLRTSDPSIASNIFRHNIAVVKRAMPNLHKNS